MRKSLFFMSAVAIGLAVVMPGEAGQISSMNVGGAGQSAGGFFGGYMPTNIVHQPVSLSGATKPTNFQGTMMPQQQSTKVFNINTAFRNVTIPVFRSGAPNVPVVPSGPNNPIQPTNAFKLNPQKVPPPNYFWPF